MQSCDWSQLLFLPLQDKITYSAFFPNLIWFWDKKGYYALKVRIRIQSTKCTFHDQCFCPRLDDRNLQRFVSSRSLKVLKIWHFLSTSPFLSSSDQKKRWLLTIGLLKSLAVGLFHFYLISTKNYTHEFENVSCAQH